MLAKLNDEHIHTLMGSALALKHFPFLKKFKPKSSGCRGCGSAVSYPAIPYSSIKKRFMNMSEEEVGKLMALLKLRDLKIAYRDKNGEERSRTFSIKKKI